MKTTTAVEKKDTAQVVKKVDTAAEPKPRRKRQKRNPRSVAPGRQTGSQQARKTAAAVLEVLGGVRTPMQAAEALGVSLPRYYLLESRALQGLLDACEPRPAGPPVRPEKQLEKLRKETEKLKHESARYQALARATQRTVGLQPPKKGKKAGGRKKRRRKPTVRALKAAEGLRKGAEPGTHEPPVSTDKKGKVVTPAVAAPPGLPTGRQAVKSG